MSSSIIPITKEDESEEYIFARGDIFHHLCEALDDIADILEFLQNPERAEAGILCEFMTAYQERLVRRNINYRGYPDHDNLANLENNVELYRGFIAAIQKLLEDNRSKFTEDEIGGITKNWENSETMIGEFYRKYATEIAQEKASAKYGEDRTILADALNDLNIAAHGQWVPEVRTGGIESTDSVHLGNVSRAVRSGRLRLPPGLLKFEGQR